mmetsp:Transcript_68333/g.165280  ORF Transcript_68333/g.165280 Transcript_68333/m.165280 type:complete len:313 (+) Transcript_68333:436-1374(+)
MRSERAMPTPSTFMTRGEPKQAAIAMRASAPRAAAESATRSPTELPMAMTVRPRMEVEMPSRMPVASMRAIISWASRLSHAIVCTKPQPTSSERPRGAAVAEVAHQRPPLPSAPSSSSSAATGKGEPPSLAPAAEARLPSTCSSMSSAPTGGVASVQSRRRRSHRPSELGMLAHRSAARGSEADHSTVDSSPQQPRAPGSQSSPAIGCLPARDTAVSLTGGGGSHSARCNLPTSSSPIRGRSASSMGSSVAAAAAASTAATAAVATSASSSAGRTAGSAPPGRAIMSGGTAEAAADVRAEGAACRAHSDACA